MVLLILLLLVSLCRVGDEFSWWSREYLCEVCLGGVGRAAFGLPEAARSLASISLADVLPDAELLLRGRGSCGLRE